MTNIEIAKLLRNVAAAYTVKDAKKHYFQIIAYQKAAESIEKATSQVADLIREDKLDELPGVGSSIKAHLIELEKTGKAQHFETVFKDVPAAMFSLLPIPSFGPKKAYRLVTEFNLKNPDTVIEDVKKLVSEGKIAKLEGFGEKSQADILRAIGEFHQGFGKTTRMLLPFADELADKIVTYIKKHPAVKDVQPLGSLRRRLATIGDIDIAVATHKPEEVLEHFVAYPYKERVIEKGPTSASILTSGGHQVDLMALPTESFGSLLQHFTGSKHHNVHLRDLALKKNLSLSERGIKHLKEDNKMTAYATEKSFYNALGMDWIPPEMREDRGEIELAMKHELPKLVELQDMKGDLHIHSSYPIESSHDFGSDTMETMLARAKQLNYQYLGFSEHNPSVSRHTAEEITNLLKKRQEKIEELKKRAKFVRIISLLEIDILANGKLGINEKDFEYLDAGIVSIHSSFTMDSETMTKRVLQGLSHPKVKILAHPTGRMLHGRTGISLQWNKLFDFCAKEKKALEINAWPERTDLPDTLIHDAIKAGVKLVINTDSHAVDHMNLMQYGIYNARRGWATKADILNTWEYNEFIEWIKS